MLTKPEINEIDLLTDATEIKKTRKERRTMEREMYNLYGIEALDMMRQYGKLTAIELKQAENQPQRQRRTKIEMLNLRISG